MSIFIYYVLTAHFQALGVAAASAISIALYTSALSFWWRHRFGRASFVGLGKDILKLATLSIISAGPAFWFSTGNWIDGVSHIYLDALLRILASGLCFALLFSALALAFTPNLVRPFFARLGPVGRLFARCHPGREPRA